MFNPAIGTLFPARSRSRGAFHPSIKLVLQPCTGDSLFDVLTFTLFGDSVDVSLYRVYRGGQGQVMD